MKKFALFVDGPRDGLWLELNSKDIPEAISFPTFLEKAKYYSENEHIPPSIFGQAVYHRNMTLQSHGDDIIIYSMEDLDFESPILKLANGYRKPRLFA